MISLSIGLYSTANSQFGKRRPAEKKRIYVSCVKSEPVKRSPDACMTDCNLFEATEQVG